MNELAIPRAPWHNPPLADGMYDAEIRRVTSGRYGKDGDTYLQFVFWLTHDEMYVVTNMYFPEGKIDNRSVLRLNRLCQCVGCIPQDALDSPNQFVGEELKITVRKMTGVNGNGGNEYFDVDLFFPADYECDDNGVVASTAK